MSTKYFHWSGDIDTLLAGEQYVGGNPIEFNIKYRPTLAIQAWHGIPQGKKVAITSRLKAAGWVEGVQSKPD